MLASGFEILSYAERNNKLNLHQDCLFANILTRSYLLLRNPDLFFNLTNKVVFLNTKLETVYVGRDHFTITKI